MNCFEWEISWKSFTLRYFGKPSLFKTLYRSLFKCREESFSFSTLPSVQTSWKPWDSRQSFILPAQFLFLSVVLVSRLFLSMIQACFWNLVMGILLSLNQYLREEIVLSRYRGYLRHIPCGLVSCPSHLIIFCRQKDELFQIFASLEVPQTWEAHKNIGLIWASKSWKNTVVSKLPRDHIVLIKSKILPLVLLAKSSQAQTLDNFVVRVYPKYLYLLTISISFACWNVTTFSKKHYFCFA